MNGELKIFLFFFILISIVVYLQKVFRQSLNYKIELTALGITINTIFYRWTEINKIYIIERPVGKGSDWYLIFALDTGVTDRYNISNLTGFLATENRLSAYIVHYKNFA